VHRPDDRTGQCRQPRSRVVAAQGFESLDQLIINTLGGDDVVDSTALNVAGAFVADGGEGNDILIGGDGIETFLGGLGDDVLIGGLGIDILDGGLGDNIIIA